MTNGTSNQKKKEDKKKVLEDIVGDFAVKVGMEARQQANCKDPVVRTYLTNLAFVPAYESQKEALENYQRLLSLNMGAAPEDIADEIKEKRIRKKLESIAYAEQNIDEVLGFLKPEQLLAYATEAVKPYEIGSVEHDSIAKIHKERNEMIENIAKGDVKKMLEYIQKGIDSEDIERYTNRILASDDERHSELISWYMIGVRSKTAALKKKLGVKVEDNGKEKIDEAKTKRYLMTNVGKASDTEKQGFYFNVALNASGYKNIKELIETLSELEKSYSKPANKLIEGWEKQGAGTAIDAAIAQQRVQQAQQNQNQAQQNQREAQAQGQAEEAEAGQGEDQG